MDTVKTGKFISEMRKKKELTQKELADCLNVSDKLISKWETGRGLPDVSVMEDLCKILGINVNELLSGEKIPSEDYSRKAEEMMMNIVQETEYTKKEKMASKIGILLGVLLLLFSIFFTITSAMGITHFSAFIDMPTLISILGILTAVLLAAGQMKNFLAGMKTALQKRSNISLKELKAEISAFVTLLIGIPTAMCLMFATGAIGIFLYFDPQDRIWSSWSGFSINFISVFYAAFMEVIVLIFYSRLKKKETQAAL